MGSLLCEGMGMGEFSQLLLDRIYRGGIPFSGSIDLTNRCNLRCVHCYLGDRRFAPPETDMATGRLVSLLDEIAANGTLFLLLTGGEPLLRPDFARIYRHARSIGLVVSIFTNGTLIDRGFARLMSEIPPNGLEISLYGASAPTYEAVSGVRGSFSRCLAGMTLLAETGIPFSLKTMLMEVNRDELAAMRGMAERFGVPFRVDAGLFPRLDGDPAPLRQRVAPDLAVAADFSDPGRARRWLSFQASHPAPPPTDALFECGAGRRSFHVKADGSLVPCLMLENIRVPLAGGDFHRAWEAIRREVSSRLAGPAYPCRGCVNKHLCGVCPAFFLLETGDAETKSEYLCAIGRERALTIQSLEATGGAEDGVERNG